jgi:diguanylate cyclase (GGDEF)-like protein
MAANASSALPPSADLPHGDRNLLVGAIAERLRCSAGERDSTAAVMRETALDCAQALEQLQATLGDRRTRGASIEVELRAAYTALAAAGVELAGTQVRERRARHQAQHDSLTSLPNRTYFRARLDDALSPVEQRTPALAVLYIDLDGFKPINDRHGHDTGDELLRIVADRLSRSVRAEDMVCRLGGDEFACLLSDPMGREQLSQLASKLFDAVSAPLQVGARQLIVRPSIGIAVCPTDGDTAAMLLKRADAAMYRAKRRQMGFAFFDRRSDI